MKDQNLIIGSEGFIRTSILNGQDILCLPYAAIFNGHMTLSTEIFLNKLENNSKSYVIIYFP